jgi:branched-chain amino acid transport system ATP-binding protein
MLEISALNVYHGNIHVIWDVSLKIGQEELVTLIGPNGAGKTTLVETIFGVNRGATGTIELDGQRILGMPPYEIFSKGLALVPEKRELFSKMTVMENLRLGARDRNSAGDVLDQIFSLFPILKERQQQQADTLSGGEQQMVAIARALMSNPKMLVLDEPSTGLSPRLVVQVFTSLEQLGREGMTILLLEQNVRHALELCKRGYVLENGRIVREGRSKDLLRDEHIQKAYLGI